MLTTKELIQLAPAAAARKPAPHCSPLYRFVPTMDVIEALDAEGYVPVAAAQDSVKNDRWGASKHARHMVRMRLRGTEALDKRRMAALGGVVPEIVMYNSSNGGSPFELHKGFFRQVCSNGLIVMVTESEFTHRHRRAAEEIIQRVSALSASSKGTFDQIQQWTKIRLDPAAQARYAAEALLLRVGGSKERAKRYDAATLLAVNRPDDEAPTLWNLFNRAQENGQKGAIEARDEQESRTGLALRPVRGVRSDFEWNTGLWAMTERWAAIK